MKARLLAKREPFGQILVETLSRYWEARTGQARHVRWGASGGARTRQRWHGNLDLNVFFTRSTAQHALADVKREFGRASVWWRGPIQRLYVDLALTSPLRYRLSPVMFDVDPPVPGLDDTILVGGNHRIRFLSPAAKQSTVVLKAGFPLSYMTGDLNLRTALSPTYAPQLIEIAPDSTWYVEEYIAGTPLNRLPPASQRDIAGIVMERHLKEVVDVTRQPIATEDYLTDVSEAIVSTTNQAHVPSPARDVSYEVLQLLTGTVRSAGVREPHVQTASTHGDFWGANILVDRDGAPTVIDWETAGRRHAAYDTFVLTTGTRGGGGWAQRVAAHFRQSHSRFDGAAGSDSRRMALACCLLEELRFVVADRLGLAIFRTLPEDLDALDEIRKAAGFLRPSVA